jgi:glycosyltransferase involved in cell wall biosynthesis
VIPPSGRIVVVHVVTGLALGGSEMALLRVATGLPRDEFECAAVSLQREGPMAPRLRAGGVPVTSLGLTGSHPMGILGLGSILARHRASVVQTWNYHADLLGGIAAARAGIPVAWGVRSSTLDAREVRLSTRAVQRACAVVSRRVPRLIVYNSASGRELHESIGYAPDRGRVIPNGFDLERYRPDPDARARERREWGLAADTPVVATFARWSAQKDFPTLVRAFAEARRIVPGARLVLAGTALDGANAELGELLRREGVDEAVLRLGPRDDVAALMASADVVAVASSWGEAFPQVVGEAMACGTPCVVTDVGDSAVLVGETGAVVPPRDPQALGAALARLLREPAPQRLERREAARARAASRYDARDVLARFADLYRELAGRSSARSS